MGRNKGRAEKETSLIFPLQFHPEVEFDMQDAWEFYESRRIGLGDEFTLAVEATLNYISRSPLHFPIVFSYTRHILIKRFPYAIFYVVTDGIVYVSSVTHLSRDPKLWRSRLK